MRKEPFDLKEVAMNNNPLKIDDIRIKVDLEYYYTYYNHLYFNDTLTPVDFIKLRWNHQLGVLAGMCIQDYKDTIIELNPIYLNFYPEEFAAIFVHEMIHLITIDHDNRFLEEIERISKLGLEVTVNCNHNISNLVLLDIE